jgi:hypothetical protein
MHFINYFQFYDVIKVNEIHACIENVPWCKSWPGSYRIPGVYTGGGLGGYPPPTLEVLTIKNI